ncbi:mechanosensitive ion channel family protein [Desulfoplanes formicivorans]|uniref:Mechanosensitive ion channel protein n=1 Tax=Desulfoplanes formicivorans TaxID=1592317 RepID=A0A194AIU1_9BACT|nr:mechanosensitive ion channel domain-containing protein [Desulfoplanes formicivorans]GAU09150.1 mechanosensitive ion channel protein [Desulfoplanes formicivorans]
MFDVSALLTVLQNMLTLYGLKILAAIFIFIIGRWVAKMLKKLLGRIMTKAGVDATIIPFALNITYTVLLLVVIIAALGALGIQTTSLIAVLGAAGLAVGLALQGSLSNFAAGILIILFRPIRVGDYFEGAGIAGTVEEIQVFSTMAKTPDNKVIIIPNSKLLSDNIINYSMKDIRRVDLTIGIGYGDPIDKAKAVLADILAKDARILADPAPTIGLAELADSSVNFAVRPWVKAADYWDVYFNLLETIKNRFDAEGINFPFPQQDIHVYKAEPSAVTN